MCMIYIFTALYPEAKPLLRTFSLKRSETELPFEVYENKDRSLRLVITGVGMNAAACGVSAVFGRYGAGETDHLLNVGTCAGNGTFGDMYLCNKITERNKGHTYYPDILYRHGLREAEIITEPTVWNGEKEKGVLHDMEAAAVYQAGSFWLGPHQMSFIKVVSDGGISERMTPQVLERAMEINLGLLETYVGVLGRISERNEEQEKREQYHMEEAEQICQELHCSQTMRAAVIQCLKYWTLAGVDYQGLFNDMRENNELPCRDRREGKKRFEEIKKRLL